MSSGREPATANKQSGPPEPAARKAARERKEDRRKKDGGETSLPGPGQGLQNAP